MTALRLDADQATAHLRERWSNASQLEAAARVVADSIRVAHAEAPGSWTLSLFNRYLRLNVGQIAVLELFSDKSELVLYRVAGAQLKEHGHRRIRWPAYRAVAVPTERWAVDLNVLPRVSAPLSEGHRELIREAARAKRISPFRRAHSSGAVTALNNLA